MPKKVDVAATTTEALSMQADAFVVIDCLRATTTIAALFAAGLAGLWVAGDIDNARRIARAESALLFGEVHGLPPEGFDLGNSPVEASRAPVMGKQAVLYTTNGTPALTALADRGAVFAAAPTNASATIQALSDYESVVFVCAGVARGTRFALEDFAAAAHLVHLVTRTWGEVVLGDLALLAAEIPEPLSLIPRAHHAEIVRSLGLSADIAFALNVDSSDVAPLVLRHGPNFAYLEAGGGTPAG